MASLYEHQDPENPGLEWSVLIRMDAAERTASRQRKELYRCDLVGRPAL